MNLTHHHVYYVFDIDDVHYTDTLLRLRPEAYLWHELRALGKADFCISLSVNNYHQLQLRTFDSSSQELLGLQKGFLGRWKTKPIRENMKWNAAQSQVTSFQKLSQSKDFWDWLGAVAREFSDCTFSVLITHDAVNRMACAPALKQLPPNCVTMIRLPGEADALERIAHGADSLGFPEGMCTENVFREQAPLMEALKRELGERMICLFPQREDILNLLLYSALREDIQDTPEQLMDQAEYLYLLWSHRKMQWLDQERYPENTVERVRLSTIAADLMECWPALRARVKNLRREYGTEISMENLMYIDIPILAEASGMGLYKTALGNQLLEIKKLLIRSKAPEALKLTDFDRLMGLATLWNKPGSERVEQRVQQCCQKAVMAIGQELWDGLEILLNLLQFSADFVCPEPGKVPDILRVLELGNEIFDKKQMLSQSNWAKNAFLGGDPTASGQFSHVVEYTHAMSDMQTKQGYDMVEMKIQTDLASLKKLIQICYGITETTAQVADSLRKIQQTAPAEPPVSAPRDLKRDKQAVDRLLYEHGFGKTYSSYDDEDDDMYEDAE